jgi:CRISPR-associated protein Cas5d
MSQGQTFNHPYFGCREFSLSFKLLEENDQIPKSYYRKLQEKDLGYMLYDVDFENKNQAKFFRAKMIYGVINTKEAEVFQ